jgi:HAE1 family hydrophobic/amphiphilic exporter-1
MRKISIYSRPVLSFFIFTAITVISLFIIRDIQFGESYDSRYTIFSVRFEYFGMDAKEIEGIITIPLEEELRTLNDLFEIRSTAEYGKSTTTLFFNRAVNEKNIYLSLRNIVDNLYNILPKAVQKPRIYSAQAGKKAIMSVAIISDANLDAVRKYVETNLKKNLEGIDGVAEVIVTGGHIDEIRVEFDHERITEIGVNPVSLGNIIQDANVVSPGGTLYTASYTDNIIFDTKIQTLEQIRRLPVKAGNEITSLEYFASININPRDADEIVRINGRECVGIQVVSASNANIINLSRSCKKIINQSSIPENDIQILTDTGELLYKIIRNVIISIIQSLALIIIIIPFFFKSLRVILLLIAMLPANIIWTSAILYLMGYSLDQNILSGISLSLGLVIDASLIISGIAEKKLSIASYTNSVNNIIKCIIASVFTTLLVLIPLFFLDSIVPGIRSVTISIAIMLINSLLISCFFFPSFIYTEKQERSVLPLKIVRNIHLLYTRIGFRTSFMSLHKKPLIVCVYFVLGIFTFLLFFTLGKNINLGIRDAVIFASAEYEPERTGISIDNELTNFIENVKKIPEVTFLRAGIRNGTAEFDIGFKDSLTNSRLTADKIHSLSPYVYSGFLYVPDAGGQNTKIHEIEVAIIGDESEKCRNFARTGASAIGSSPNTIQTVLNFKEPEQIIQFIPDRDILAKSNISVQSVASTLRWILFGPVVDKWVQDNTETDIRVAGREFKNTNLDRISNVYIPSPSGGIRIDTLGNLEQADGTGKIYRRDGRRAAYFTAHLKSGSSKQAVSHIKSILADMPMDKGYGFLLPRELEHLNREYNVLFLAFIGSIIGILLLLTALTEKFSHSLIITSIIPVSCTLPLLIKFITHTPLEMGDITGLVLISGLNINNAIYILESQKSIIAFRVREKIRSILVTSLTNLASSVPLMIMSRNSFSTALASSIFWGTIGSLLVTLLLFPAVWSLSDTFRKK